MRAVTGSDVKGKCVQHRVHDTTVFAHQPFGSAGICQFISPSKTVHTETIMS